MRNYELVVIFDAKLDEEALNAQIEKVSGLVTADGGEVVKADKWGKRKLAYEINDLSEGFYVIYTFKSSVKTMQEIERVLKISEVVIRHMVVKLDEE